MPPKKGELTVNAETEEQLIEYLKKPGITLVEVTPQNNSPSIRSIVIRPGVLVDVGDLELFGSRMRSPQIVLNPLNPWGIGALEGLVRISVTF